MVILGFTQTGFNKLLVSRSDNIILILEKSNYSVNILPNDESNKPNGPGRLMGSRIAVYNYVDKFTQKTSQFSAIFNK